MSSPAPEDVKPDLTANKRKRKVEEILDDSSAGPRTPAKKGKGRPSTSDSPVKNKSRTLAPPILPSNLKTPLAGARDSRLLVAWVEKVLDESSPDGRRDMAVAFGIPPAAFSQAWGDSLKFRLQKIIRAGLLNE